MTESIELAEDLCNKDYIINADITYTPQQSKQKCS